MRHDSTSRADDHDGRTTDVAGVDSSGADSGVVRHDEQRAVRVDNGKSGASVQSARRRLNEKPIGYTVTAKGWRA